MIWLAELLRENYEVQRVHYGVPKAPEHATKSVDDTQNAAQ